MKKKMMLLVGMVLFAHGVHGSSALSTPTNSVLAKFDTLRSLAVMSADKYERNSLLNIATIVKNIEDKTISATNIQSLAENVSELISNLKKNTAIKNRVEYLSQNIDTIKAMLDMTPKIAESNYYGDTVTTLFAVLHEALDPLKKPLSFTRNTSAFKNYEAAYNHSIIIVQAHNFLMELDLENAQLAKFMNESGYQGKSHLARQKKNLLSLDEMLMKELPALLKKEEASLNLYFNPKKATDTLMTDIEDIRANHREEASACDALIKERKQMLDDQKQTREDTINAILDEIDQFQETFNIEDYTETCEPNVIEQKFNDMETIFEDENKTIKQKIDDLTKKTTTKNTRTQAQFDAQKKKIIQWADDQKNKSWLSSANIFSTDDDTYSHLDTDAINAMDYDDFKAGGSKWPKKETNNENDELNDSSNTFDSLINGRKKTLEFEQAMRGNSTLSKKPKSNRNNDADEEDEEEEELNPVDEIEALQRQNNAIKSIGGAGGLIKAKLQNEALLAVLSGINNLKKPTKQKKSSQKSSKPAGTKPRVVKK